MRARHVAALIGVFVLLLPAVTTRLNASDEIQFFSWLRSWTFDRDVDFDNEYRYFYDLAPEKHIGFKATFLDGTNEAGHRQNFTPIGTAILWSPFYAVGHLVALATGAQTNGLSAPYIAAVTYGSAVYGLAALLLSAASAFRLIGSHGTFATAAVWAGTPLFFYMYLAPGFGHAASAFVVAAFIYLWLRVRADWTPSGVAALGVVAAFLPMTREQDGFLVIAPAIDFVRWAWRNRGTTRVPDIVQRAAVGVGAATLTYLPQLMAYQALNGRFGPARAVSRKMDWTSPYFADVLVSVEHGLLMWTPLVAIAIAGLLWLAIEGRGTATVRDRSWVAGLLLFMVGLQAYGSGAVLSWTVAGSFGQRRFVALTAVLVVGVAALVSLTRGVWRVVTVAMIALCIWWNLGLMAQFGLHEMDRQRLTLAANARKTFIELPLRAPAIAWRYLTNHQSLYGLPRGEQP